MKVLSKVLKNDGIKGAYNDELNELDKLIKKVYPKIIEKGSFTEKAKSLQDMEDLKNYIQAFIQHSVFVGKTVIGVMNSSTKLRNRFLNNVLEINGNETGLRYNNSVPVIYYFSEEKNVEALNIFDIGEDVKREDLKVIFQDLMYNKKMDLRQVITSIVHGIKIPYENIVIIDFPQHGVKYNKEYTDLVNCTDFIVYNMEYDKYWKKTINYLDNIKYQSKLYVHCDEDNSELESLLQHRQLDYEFVEEINGFLNNKNNINYNINFVDRIDNILLEGISFYKHRINQSLDVLGKINRNLVLWEDEGKEDLIKIKNDIKKDISHDEVLLEELKEFKENIIDVLNTIIINMEIFYKESYNAALNEGNMEELNKRVLYRNAIKYIKLEEYEKAQFIINRLRSLNYSKYRILNIMLNRNRGAKISYEDIQYLKYIKDKDRDILKAKVELRQMLGITDLEAGMICEEIGFLDTAEELYIMAKYIENRDLSGAKRYYRLAFERGHKKAGEELFHKYLNKDINGIRYLANLLHPDANYILGEYYISEKKYGVAIFHYKLAGIFDHMDSIVKLGDIYFNRDCRKSISLYNYVIKKGGKNKELLTKLGEGYYILKDYNKAHDVLMDSNTAKAYFLLGKIYDFGLGRMKDLQKAKKYYRNAKNIGHDGANANYQKVCARLESIKETNKSRSTYTSTSSYSSSSYTSSSDEGGCFLTTATCNVLGKGDDCEELILFKKYRDQYLIKEDDGPGLIKEYYKIAPKILEEIDSHPNREEIYKKMWDKYIDRGYRYLLEENYKKAKETYIEMVKDLCHSYKVQYKNLY